MPPALGMPASSSAGPSRASQNQANNVSDTLDTSLAASGNSVSSATLSSRSAFSGLLFGGYRVDRYLAAELAYINFGSLGLTYAANTTAGPLTVDGIDQAQAFGVSALGTWPITRQWGLFARLGLAHYWESQSATASFAGATSNLPVSSDSGLTAVYGLGTSYRIGATTWRVSYDIFPSVAKGFASVSGGVAVFGLSGQYAF